MRADEPRVYVRLSAKDRETLERYSQVSGVSLGGLMREVTLAYGPVWIANRASDRVAGRPVQRVRARNVQAVRRQVP